MENEKLFIDKELSWLSFNERVLQEAADPSVPIIERMRFLGIFSNNLDEFFRVRVANTRRRLVLEGSKSESGSNTSRLLSKIQQKVLRLNEDFDRICLDVIKGLARQNIFLINEQQLNEEQGKWLKRYFRDRIMRHITPIIVDRYLDLASVLKDDTTYLVASLRSTEKIQYAFIEVPSKRVSRFIQVPREAGKRRRDIILLDNIIRYCLDELFADFFEYETAEAYSMKMTRDAAYDLDENVDLSILERMSGGLKQRLTGQPVRFVYDREMPEAMVEVIKFKLGIKKVDATIPGGRYHNFRDFISFPNVGRKHLENPKLTALSCAAFREHETVFNSISRQDILLHYPYHKFRHFTEFVRQAAYDPNVRAIKLNIYRVAKQSRIISSLISAAENGKEVMVVVELQARFDEEANIEWARQLTEAGVKVDFGAPGLKCHSKLCLISRMEDGELARYAHIGTGNFHEKTAKIYTDFSLFTKNPALTEEVENVFDFIVNPYKQHKFNHLLVSPNDSRNNIYALIDAETEAAKQGKRAEIFIKINNLVDRGVISHLYQASSAGVKIRLIIRGMCALVPGIKGVSENIEIISIVDRFLEHPRVAIFHAGGDNFTFISSADWMTRNIDRRVEVGCPIYQSDLKQVIRDVMEIQWSDTTKARIIDKDQSNQYKPRGNKRKIRSQLAIYDYLKRLEENNAKIDTATGTRTCQPA